jgi:hypothetical protein
MSRLSPYFFDLSQSVINGGADSEFERWWADRYENQAAAVVGGYMKWVDDEKVFESVYQHALDCVAIDSGRLRTSLEKMTYNDVDVLSNAFAELLQKLLEWSSEKSCFFAVLRPDPVYYFHRLFGSYPVVEIARGMNASEYLAVLNEGPDDSRADALGTIYSEYVLVPPSSSWFIHALRSAENDGGHLWIPSEWAHRVTQVYPYATVVG